MDDEWINIEGESISLKETPALLRELNLMPIFLKKYYEAKYTKDIIPTEEEQVIFQKYFLKKEGIEDDQSLKNWLSNNHKSEKEMNKILYNALRIEIFKKKNFQEHLEAIFVNRKSDLDRVTYSLIRVKSRAKAAELHLRLKEEESTFQDLASTYSEGVENLFQGLIGPVEFGKVHPLIAERLKNSSPGDLWPPFEFESFWLILRLERFLPSTLNDAMKSRLLNEMYEEWIQDKIMKTMKNLEKSLEKKS